jgi:branched-chain amino acid aminotransferase
VIVTPTLTGSLLPGITRRSLLRLARDLGHRAEERRVSVADWKARAEDGSLTEVFACGTAAVITPVGSVKSRSEKWVIGAGSAGPITMRLRKTLLDIQVGIAPDTHGWMRKVV